MNKSDTMAYYDAIGSSSKLICIDSTDTIGYITDELNTHIADDNEHGSFHIEIFHNDESVTSYQLLPQTDGSYDLWCNKNKSIERKSIDVIAAFITANMPKAVISPYKKYVAAKNNDGTYLIKDFGDSSYEMILDPKSVSTETLNDHILGQYCYSDGVIEWHPINNTDTSDFDEFIKLIVNEDLRVFAKTCLRIIPDYVFTVPASNDSEHKPASDLADGGLKRHTINALKMLIKMTELNYAHIKFTQHEIDMMMIAMIFHDFLKSGWQEDYEKNSSTRFDHPRLAAKALRCVRDIIPANDLLFITNCIESHNGQFNTNPDDPDAAPLPIPDTECKYTVHLAVYLTSFSNIATDSNEVYVYRDQHIHTINKYIPLSDDNVKIISNVLGMDAIDMEKAKSLDIHHDEDDIRKILASMIESRRVTERQMKYVELANNMLFY